MMICVVVLPSIWLLDICSAVIHVGENTKERRIVTLVLPSLNRFSVFSNILLESDSCRGDSQGRSRFLILPFSPLFCFFCCSVFFLFFKMSGRFTGEEIFYDSRSPSMNRNLDFWITFFETPHFAHLSIFEF